MSEKPAVPATTTTPPTPVDKPSVVILVILACILTGIVIAIPVVYVRGRGSGSDTDVSFDTTKSDINYTNNECTQTSSNVKTINYIVNSEPFPYKFYSHRYRPSVVAKQVSLIFGFRHDNKSWSIDEISVVDTTTKLPVLADGGFESNYLNQYYTQCILSSTRSSVSDIYFDLPYEGDFYYNDQTNVGMTFLSQPLTIIGGRYYNISYYLENRGYANNTFILLVGS